MIVPSDRFLSFVHHHHALIGHPRLRCAHLSRPRSFSSEPILSAPLLFWLSPAEPRVVPNVFARVSSGRMPSHATRALRLALQVDGAWPPRYAAVPRAPFLDTAPDRTRSDGVPDKKPERLHSESETRRRCERTAEGSNARSYAQRTPRGDADQLRRCVPPDATRYGAHATVTKTEYVVYDSRG